MGNCDYGEDDFEDEELPQAAAPATQAQACGCIMAFLGTVFGRYNVVAL